MMRMYVEGVGLLGPGLDSWEASREVLAGRAVYQSTPTKLRAPEMLPPAERRRAGVPIKLALAAGKEAFEQSGCDMSKAATVFTSSGGDNDNVHAINGILATAPREVSPTRFHNSVHNAAAGYWCIAAGTHEPSTSLCAHDASFAAGLLESAAQVSVDGAQVALIAYDHCYPEPLNAVRPIIAAFGAALVLTPQRSAKSLALIEVGFVSGSSRDSVMQDAGLEFLRTSVPAARCLPLLAALSEAQPAQINIAWLAGNHLAVRVTPC